MSATTYHTIDTNGYLSNVANAARQLFAAVFAVQPAVSQRNKEETIWWLTRMANDCEMHSPSLSAELRHFASR